MHAPTDTHWQAVKRLLQYLKGFSLNGLTLSTTSFYIYIYIYIYIFAYFNVNWASCPNDRKNTGSYCVFFDNNLVSWSASKQKVVSLSSTKSEHSTVANATSKLVWI